MSYKEKSGTKWLYKPKGDIQKITSSIDNQIFTIDIIIEFPKRIFIKIKTDSFEVYSYLQSNFSINLSEASDFIFYYIINKKIKAHYKSEINIQESDVLCYFDSIEHVVLTFGINSQGLLKSILFGLASYKHIELGYYPLHASAFLINDIGVVVIGSHGKGKTTTLFNLISCSIQEYPDAELSFLNDDWILVNQEEDRLRMTSIENSISIREQLVLTFPELGLNEVFQKRKSKLGKVDLRVEDIFKNVKYSNTSYINKIFVLTEKVDNRYNQITEFVEEVQISTSHMPYIGIEERVSSFWINHAKYCEIMYIPSRFDLDLKDSHYKNLLSIILK